MLKSLSSVQRGNFISNLKGKITPSVIAGVLFVILLICIGYYYYRTVVTPKLSAQFTANREIMHGDDGANQAEIILFSVDWCPHCKTAKPEWDNFKKQVQGTSVKGYTIVCNEVNCTNETAEVEALVKKYKIEGYPTIKLLKDGQVIDFEAKPTQNTLNQFLQTAL